MGSKVNFNVKDQLWRNDLPQPNYSIENNKQISFASPLFSFSPLQLVAQNANAYKEEWKIKCSRTSKWKNSAFYSTYMSIEMTLPIHLYRTELQDTHFYNWIIQPSSHCTKQRIWKFKYCQSFLARETYFLEEGIDDLV